MADHDRHDAVIAGLAELGRIDTVRSDDLLRAEVTVRAFQRARRQRTRARVAWAGGVAALAAVLVLAVLTVPGLRGTTVEVDSGSFTLAQDTLDAGAKVPTGEWMRVDGQRACLKVEARRACVEPGARLRVLADGGIELDTGRVRVDAGMPVVTAMGEVTSDAAVELEVAGDIFIVHEGMATLSTAGTSTVLEPGAHAKGGATPALVVARPDHVERRAVPEVVPDEEPVITAGDEPKPVEAVAVRKASARPSEPKPVPTAAELLVAARDLASASKLEPAARAYQKLIDTYPASSEARAAFVSLGRVQASRGKHAAALAAFDAYLKRGSGALSEEAHWGKIAALHALGRTADREAAIAALAAKHPKSVYLGKAKKLAGG